MHACASVLVLYIWRHVSCVLTHREDELKAAIAAHEDVDVLQKLCEGRQIPAELRADLWKVSHLVPSFLLVCACVAGVSGCVTSSRHARELEWPSRL